MAKPVDMSCMTSSVMLAMKAAHAADAHVSGVRGLLWSSSSLSSLHEDISPNLYLAPVHMLVLVLALGLGIGIGLGLSDWDDAPLKDTATSTCTK